MKILASILFWSLFTSCFGQNELTVLTEDLQAIPGAKVEGTSITNNGVSVRLITNFEGKVNLPETSDIYTVKISYTGFITYLDTLPFSELNQVVLLPLLSFESVVVTAQRTAVAAEKAVQRINVISSEQIKSSGAINLGDILNYQSGIRLKQDNILGSSMDLAGISGQNVKILIDGIPVIGRQNGNVDLSQINLNNVERIEIIEGPLSVNYGTNALAGTINIITKKNGKKGISIQLNPMYETIGNYNLTGSISLNKKQHFLILDGGRNFFDGWNPQDGFMKIPKETLADTNRFQTWKPKEQYFGGLKYGFSKPNIKYLFYGNYFNEFILNRGLPSAPYYEVAFDDEYNTARLDAGTSIAYNFKKSKITSLIALNNFVRKKSTYRTDLTTLEKVITASENSQDTSKFRQFSGRVNYFNQINGRVTYQAGIDLNHSVGWGKRISSGRKEIGDYATFLTSDIKISDSLILKPGIRYAYNTAYKAPLIPSLNVLYKKKQLSFRVSAARGFRSPDLKELFMDFVDVNHNITGNPELRAEESWNYTLFVNWMKETKKRTFYKIEYGAYFNKISNMITLGIIEDNSYSYINIGKFSTIGQKLSLIYRGKKMDLSSHLSYIGRFNPDSELTNIKKYSFSPDLAIQMKYDLIKGKLHANLFYKFNGRLQSFTIDNNANISSITQSPYHILDASFSADLFAKKQLSITVGAKNILNVQQVSVLGNSDQVHSVSSSFSAGRGVSAFIALHFTFQSTQRKHEK